MALSKLNLILFLLTMGYIEPVTSQCPSEFPSGDDTNICYYYTSTSLSWSDAYNQCLTKTTDGILIEISSIEQFNALKNANIDSNDPFWLGANNFAAFHDSQWHWLDGSIVDNSVITWCPDSTYDTAIGAYCAAYDSTSQCVTNYLCSTLLPAPCVEITNGIEKQERSVRIARSIDTGTCTTSYGGAYGNWWAYTLLLLNWFTLFCFILYLCARFYINKRAAILTMCILIGSFIMIFAFAILWGLQYRNAVLISLIVVIIGCIASLLLLVHILILVSNRIRVLRWKVCMILTIITIVIECCLMLGLILCIANCSEYISLTSTSVDKDIIAALLAAVIAAITIGFSYGILYFIGHPNPDRLHRVGSNPNNLVSAIATQPIISRQSQPFNAIPSRATTRNHEPIDRGTSPVDDRILGEFYSDHPRQMHEYQLNGRQYIVYEGKTFTDVDAYRKDLTQAMLLQEPQGLREAIARAKSSPHASTLADEIRQAEGLLARLN